MLGLAVACNSLLVGGGLGPAQPSTSSTDSVARCSIAYI
jgi:hypothetical protein